MSIELTLEQWKVILEALDISAAWHKHDLRFLSLQKILSIKLK